MRTVALLLLVGLLAAAGSYLMWRDLLGPTPFGPARPAPPPKYDPETPEMRALLDTPLPEGFRCRGRRDECYEAIGRATGVDIRPRWQAMIWALDVTRHDHADVDVGGMRLRDALLQLAAPGPKAREKPGLIVAGPTVSVTTERAANEFVRDNDPSLQTVTRVYAVNDLLPPPATVPAGDHQARVGELLSTLDAEARVYQWHDGSGGRVRELGGQLIVTQTVGRQQEVAWALDRLRWKRGGLVLLRNAGAVVLSAVALAAAARFGLRRRWLARMAATRHCVGCGYDLRASTGACPECGLTASAGR